MKQKGAHNIDWELIAKDISGELSSEEHDDLNKRLLEEKDLIGQLSVMWGDAKYAQEVKSIDTDKAWSRVRSSIKPEKNGNRVLSIGWRKVISVAAVLSILFTSYFMIKLIAPQVKMNSAEATVSIEKIQLVDGSVVDLNVGSSLEYPEEFDGDTRTVKLNGEAFFNVAKDADKPFVIQTSQLQIRVLGTSFNVKANSLNGHEVVTVSTGKVEVIHGTEKVILVKGEVADFDVANNRLVKKGSSDVNYKSWKTRIIEFDNTGLLEVFSTIENVYNVSISVDEEIIIDSLVINADFSHDDLHHVLGSVCNTFNLSFVEVGNKYQITKVQ